MPATIAQLHTQHVSSVRQTTGICLIQTTLDCFTEAAISFKKIECRIDDQLPGSLASMTRNLRQAGLLLGGEVQLHSHKAGRPSLNVNREAALLIAVRDCRRVDVR